MSVGVNPQIAAATAARVLRQLRHDPRTIALLMLVPCVLITLLRYILDSDPQSFQRIGAPMVGMFPFISMFIVTSITMLRERTTGTLERLMSMPLAKGDLLFGYGAAFAIVAAIQATLVAAVAFLLLGLDVAGPTWGVIALAIANATLGMSLGLFASAFARTEFQAVQFQPAFILPQMLLSGLFVPRPEMASALEAASWALPLTYAFDALARVTAGEQLEGALLRDVAITLGTTVLALALAAATLRRRTE